MFEVLRIGIDESLDHVAIPKVDIFFAAESLLLELWRLEDGQLRVRAFIAKIQIVIRPKKPHGCSRFGPGGIIAGFIIHPGRLGLLPGRMMEGAVEIKISLDARRLD